MYLYALAVSGSAVAYMPFLTILLPLRATDISGTDALGMLAIAAFLGAITASMANIGLDGPVTKPAHDARGYAPD